MERERNVWITGSRMKKPVIIWLKKFFFETYIYLLPKYAALLLALLLFNLHQKSCFLKMTLKNKHAANMKIFLLFSCMSEVCISN